MTEEQKQENITVLSKRIGGLIAQLERLGEDVWEAKLRPQRVASNQLAKKALEERKKELDELLQSQTKDVEFDQLLNTGNEFCDIVAASVHRQEARKQLGRVVREFFETEEACIRKCTNGGKGHSNAMLDMIDRYEKQLQALGLGQLPMLSRLEERKKNIPLFDQVDFLFSTAGLQEQEVLACVDAVFQVFQRPDFKEQIEKMSVLLVGFDDLRILFNTIAELKECSKQDKEKIAAWSIDVFPQPFQRLPRYVLLLKEMRKAIEEHSKCSSQKFFANPAINEDRLIENIDTSIRYIEGYVGTSGREQDLLRFEDQLREYCKSIEVRERNLLDPLINALGNARKNLQTYEGRTSHFILIYEYVKTVDKDSWDKCFSETTKMFIKKLLDQAVAGLLKEGTFEEWEAFYNGIWNNGANYLFKHGKALEEIFKRIMQSKPHERQGGHAASSLMAGGDVLHLTHRPVYNADDMFGSVLPLDEAEGLIDQTLGRLFVSFDEQLAAINDAAPKKCSKEAEKEEVSDDEESDSLCVENENNVLSSPTVSSDPLTLSPSSVSLSSCGSTTTSVLGVLGSHDTKREGKGEIGAISPSLSSSSSSASSSSYPSSVPVKQSRWYEGANKVRSGLRHPAIGVGILAFGGLILTGFVIGVSMLTETPLPWALLRAGVQWGCVGVAGFEGLLGIAAVGLTGAMKATKKPDKPDSFNEAPSFSLLSGFSLLNDDDISKGWEKLCTKESPSGPETTYTPKNHSPG